MSDLRAKSLLLIATLLFVSPVFARDVEVLVESRKGIGLIPSFWNGAVYAGGEFPVEGLNWVHIDPTLVATAWREKIGGGGPGWVALDGAIDAARLAGARVLLPLPTSAAPKNEATWSARVEDTVRRTHDRVDRYDIQGDVTVSSGRYLDLYEAGVWAAYQGYHKAVVGGPGVGLESGLPQALMQLCSDRDLPIAFVSWAVKAQTGEEAEASFSRVEGTLDRVGFKDRPAAIVSKWMMDDLPNASGVTLSFLHSLTQVNLDAAFAELRSLRWGMPALRIYHRLGQVEIPMLFEPEDELHGVATLDGDDVRMLLWSDRTSQANLSISGMRWGRTYAYERSVVGLRRTQVVETSELRAEDPVKISVTVSRGSPMFLTLTPRN